MEKILTTVVVALLTTGAFVLMAKKPKYGWFVFAVIFIGVNWWLGSAWIAILPGAILKEERYAPLYIAQIVEVGINLYQYLLFSGTLIKDKIDKVSEWLFLICGIIVSVSDVFANSIPWAVGGEINASTVLSEWGKWFRSGLESLPQAFGIIIVLCLSTVLAVGGEYALSRIYRIGGMR